MVIAGAVGILALPSAVLAVSARFDVQSPEMGVSEGVGKLGSSAVDPRLDPRLASAIAAQPHAGGLFRFTPAGTATRPDRSITVAVRVDPATASAITVRGILPERPQVATAAAAVHIAPTAYNLGVAGLSRGTAPVTGLSPDIRRIEMPDLAAYKPGGNPDGGPSRFSPRIALDEREKPGRAPRTFEGSGDQTVDLGGSYRLTRNLDVTAGVRYSQERDRLAPIVDGKQNSQAVYVGTQFHF
ncbi:MAG: hypothetical protein KGL44_01365 [Sphingomonadales bacterium]|nr:hypothetical protein [Sphingomonadales bacterium]